MIFFIDENQDNSNKLENNKNDKNSLDNLNSHIDKKNKDRSQNDNQLLLFLKKQGNSSSFLSYF